MFEVFRYADRSIRAGAGNQTSPKFFGAQRLLGTKKRGALFGPERQRALLGVLRNGNVPSLRSHTY
jgi:hypothetical protein